MTPEERRAENRARINRARYGNEAGRPAATPPPTRYVSSLPPRATAEDLDNAEQYFIARARALNGDLFDRIGEIGGAYQADREGNPHPLPPDATIIHPTATARQAIRHGVSPDAAPAVLEGIARRTQARNIFPLGLGYVAQPFVDSVENPDERAVIADRVVGFGRKLGEWAGDAGEWLLEHRHDPVVDPRILDSISSSASHPRQAVESAAASTQSFARRLPEHIQTGERAVGFDPNRDLIEQIGEKTIKYGPGLARRYTYGPFRDEELDQQAYDAAMATGNDTLAREMAGRAVSDSSDAGLNLLLSPGDIVAAAKPLAEGVIGATRAARRVGDVARGAYDVARGDAQIGIRRAPEPASSAPAAAPAAEDDILSQIPPRILRQSQRSAEAARADMLRQSRRDLAAARRGSTDRNVPYTIEVGRRRPRPTPEPDRTAAAQAWADADPNARLDAILGNTRRDTPRYRDINEFRGSGEYQPKIMARAEYEALLRSGRYGDEAATRKYLQNELGYEGVETSSGVQPWTDSAAASVQRRPGGDGPIDMSRMGLAVPASIAGGALTGGALAGLAAPDDAEASTGGGGGSFPFGQIALGAVTGGALGARGLRAEGEAARTIDLNGSRLPIFSSRQVGRYPSLNVDTVRALADSNLTIGEAARRLGVSESGLGNVAIRNQIPFRRAPMGPSPQAISGRNQAILDLINEMGAGETGKSSAVAQRANSLAAVARRWNETPHLVEQYGPMSRNTVLGVFTREKNRAAGSRFGEAFNGREGEQIGTMARTGDNVPLESVSAPVDEALSPLESARAARRAAISARRPPDAAILAGLAAPPTVLAIASGDQAQAGEVKRLADGRTLRPPPGGDLRSGQWLEPSWSSSSLSDRTDVITRTMLGPDGRVHILVGRQRPDAGIEIIGEVGPEGDAPNAPTYDAPTPPPPPTGTQRDFWDYGGPPELYGARSQGYLESPEAPPEEPPPEHSPLELPAALALGLITRGGVRALRGGRIASDVAGALAGGVSSYVMNPDDIPRMIGVAAGVPLTGRYVADPIIRQAGDDLRQLAGRQFRGEAPREASPPIWGMSGPRSTQGAPTGGPAGRFPEARTRPDMPDPERVARGELIQSRMGIMRHVETENAARAQLGLPPISPEEVRSRLGLPKEAAGTAADDLGRIDASSTRPLLPPPERPSIASDSGRPLRNLTEAGPGGSLGGQTLAARIGDPIGVAERELGQTFRSKKAALRAIGDAMQRDSAFADWVNKHYPSVIGAALVGGAVASGVGQEARAQER